MANNKREIEMEMKKILLKLYGVEEDVDPKKYEEILARDIETLYARLTFLDEVGTLKENMSEAERKEMLENLTYSNEEFAREHAKLFISLMDSLSKEQQAKLKGFDYSKEYHLGDKKDRKTYAGAINKLLTVVYPYENSLVEEFVKRSYEDRQRDKEVEEIVEYLGLTPEFMEEVLKRDKINPELLKSIAYSMVRDLLDNVEIPIEEIMPVGHQERNYIGGIKEVNYKDSITPEEYENLVKLYGEALEKAFRDTGAEIIEKGISLGGTKKIEQKTGKIVTSQLNPKTNEVELVEEDMPRSKREKVTGYFAIQIKDKIILEAIGQYGNGTYVIPKERFQEAKRLQRMELRKMPTVTYIPHKVSYYDGGKSRLFRFDDHLFRIMYSIHSSAKTISGDQLKDAVKKLDIGEFDLLKEIPGLEKYFRTGSRSSSSLNLPTGASSPNDGDRR